MKTYTFFSFAGLLFGLLFLIKACPPTASKEEVKYTEDCFADRKTQETLDHQKGRIIKVAENYLILMTDDENRRFNPCNLDAQFQEDRIEIIFSGMVKEVFPNERWPGTPFVIQGISQQ